MANIFIIVIIILVFSFIMALVISGNDNRITDKERASMTDDVNSLFEDEISDNKKDDNFTENEIHEKTIIETIDDDII